MRKILIFSTFLFLIILFATNFVLASGVDMNLGTSGDASQTYSQAPIENTPQDTTDVTPVSVGSTAALSSSSLSLSNILNIILIVLGILLVLFAIAILLRIR